MAEWNGYACERRGSWLAGCRFEPRYESKGGDTSYLGDICTRCGQWMTLNDNDAAAEAPKPEETT